MPQVKRMFRFIPAAAIALACLGSPVHAQQGGQLTDVEAYYYVLRKDGCNVRGVSRTAARIDEIRKTVSRETYDQEMAYKRVNTDAGPAHCVAEQMGHLLSGVPISGVQGKINDRLQGRRN